MWSKFSACVAVNAPKGIVFVLILTVTNFDASPTIHNFASCRNLCRQNLTNTNAAGQETDGPSLKMS